MKRFLAIMLFLGGGFSFELSNPCSCTLIHVSRPQEKRRII
jgi:hypothetical protein